MIFVLCRAIQLRSPKNHIWRILNENLNKNAHILM